MTITNFLQKHRAEFSPIDLEMLFCEVLQKPHDFLITHGEYILNLPQQSQLESFLEKRRQGYGVAVILGKKAFYGREFFVNDQVLIPRPSTETMIEKVLESITNEENNDKWWILNDKLTEEKIIELQNEKLKDWKWEESIKVEKFKNIKGESDASFSGGAQRRTENPGLQNGAAQVFLLSKRNLEWRRKNQNIRFLDIGTGSGIIPITLFLEMFDLEPLSDLTPRFFASDISSAALGVARKNAEKHEAPITFFESDLFQNIPKQHFHIITANIPYVPEGEGDVSTKMEPDLALYSGQDGLDIYRRLARELEDVSFDVLFLEIASSQLSSIWEIFWKFWEITMYKDLEGFDRIVRVEAFGNYPWISKK